MSIKGVLLLICFSVIISMHFQWQCFYVYDANKIWLKNNNHWGWRIRGVNWLVRNSLMSTIADERISCWLPQIHIAGNHHWTWTTCICQSPENSEPQHEHLNFIRMCFSNVLVSAKRLAIIKKNSNVTVLRNYNCITGPQQINRLCLSSFWKKTKVLIDVSKIPFKRKLT